MPHTEGVDLTTETDDKKLAKKPRKPRPRPSNGVAFTVWSENGTPLSPAAIKQFEDAIQRVQFELFNDGVRLLSQTTRA